MSTRLRAMIADDEPLARARLRRLLDAAGTVEIVAECADGDEAVDALRRYRPDVAFLDIRMPLRDGFGVLDGALPGSSTQVVFVTAYAEHAVRAFEADAADYLLKPLSPRRLADALARVRRVHEDRSRMAVGYEPLQRLAVPAGEGMHLLEVGTIDCILASANYVDLHVGGGRFRLRQSLRQMQARLDGQRFLRVHRSTIVRIAAIRNIEVRASGRYVLHLDNGMRVGTGRLYRERIRAVLGLGGGPGP